MNESTVPVPVVGLEYQDRSADPWRAVVRLASAAVVGQGATTAVYLFWRTLVPLVTGQMPSISWRFLGPGYAVEVLMAGVATGLAVAGWSARRGRPGGRVGLMVLEPALALLSIAEGVITAVQFVARYGLNRMGINGFFSVQVLLSVLPSLVLPALAWAFFRRPEVRATFEAA